MSPRPFLFGTVVLASATLAGQHSVAAQANAPAASNQSLGDRKWAPPVAADGHADLQGVWVNKSATPLERPKELEGRQFLTDAEVAELKSRADRLFANGASDFPVEDDFFLAVLTNTGKYKSPRSTSGSEFLNEREFDNRTSLITDPSFGKIPQYTQEGQKRQADNVAAIKAENHPRSPKDLTGFQRCITWGVPVVRSTDYTSHYQIVQTPDHVMLLNEAVQNVRIIPLNDQPHLPQSIRSWNGDSRGHWEGNALVVDTTNFSRSTNFFGSSEGLHLVERFSRFAAGELRYEITISDPDTWTRPWTVVLLLKQTNDKIYESACHEGNARVVEGMLLGAQETEKNLK